MPGERDVCKHCAQEQHNGSSLFSEILCKYNGDITSLKLLSYVPGVTFPVRILSKSPDNPSLYPLTLATFHLGEL